jgi:hypothetical protein
MGLRSARALASSPESDLAKGTSREHPAISMSHGCCTEEIGTAASLWNREETCCSVLQMQKAPGAAPYVGLSH